MKTAWDEHKSVYGRLAEYCRVNGDTAAEVAETTSTPITVNEHINQMTVVLPCKVGDTVYYPYANRVLEKKVTEYRELMRENGEIDRWFCVDFSDDETFSVDDIGKDIFLTREAAEAALAAGKGE